MNFEKTFESGSFLWGKYDDIKKYLPDNLSDFCRSVKEELSCVPFYNDSRDENVGKDFYICLFDEIEIKYDDDYLIFDIENSYIDMANYISQNVDKNEIITSTMDMIDDEGDGLYEFYTEYVVEELSDIMKNIIDDLCLHPDFYNKISMEENDESENIRIRIFKQKLKYGDMPWHKKKTETND